MASTNTAENGIWNLEFPIGTVETKMQGPYKRGDRLLTERPWVFVVSEKCREEICNHCFIRKPGLRKCAGCGYNWYCGKECQKLNWKFIHKHECPFFKRALEAEETTVPLGIEIVRLCLQAVIRIKNDPDWDKPAHGYPELNHRIFPNLMSHWEDIKQEQKELDFIDLMSAFFYKMLKDQGDYEDITEPQKLGTIYGKMRINNMTIFGTYGDKLGVGLYLSASAIDHACVPSACPSFSGTVINIHATEDVDCFDNVRLSYLDQIYFSKPRREMLQKRYYFDCFCRGCVDPDLDKKMNAVLCAGRSCSGRLLMDPYSFHSDPCSECGQDAKDSTIQSVREVLEKGRKTQAVMAEAKKRDDHSTVLHEAEKLYEILIKVLHKTNSLVISTSLQVAVSSDILSRYESAYFHFSQLAKTYQHVFSPWCFHYAEILMKCTTRGLLVKTSYKDQHSLIQHFVEAMKVISVCAGKDSPTFAYYRKFYDDCREVCLYNKPAS